LISFSALILFFFEQAEATHVRQFNHDERLVLVYVTISSVYVKLSGKDSAISEIIKAFSEVRITSMIQLKAIGRFGKLGDLEQDLSLNDVALKPAWTSPTTTTGTR